jgi:hypothetical protein
MPAFDGNGPCGEGPRTGRGLGFCGRDFRRGIGFRRGFSGNFDFRSRNFLPLYNRENLSMTEDEEKKILEQELKNLEAEKKEIEKRIKEIK